jgi:hypothetical protein
MARTRAGLDEDFIGSLETRLDIYGIRQDPSQPPLEKTYLTVTAGQDGSAGRSRLALPAFKGEKGDPGPGFIFQGDRTAAELAALREALSADQKNWSYRCSDDNDLWVWSGTRFIISKDAFGAEGPQGPPPILTGGTVTVDGEVLDAPLGTSVTGSETEGIYAVSLALPKLPKGDKGDTGPAGSIFTSPDITGGPEDGEILVFDEDSGKMTWQSGYLGRQLVNVPSSAFATFEAGINATKHVITAVSLPAMPYRYRIEVGGSVEVRSLPGQTVDVQVRLNDPNNGALVGNAWGDMESSSWATQRFESFSDAAVTPDNPGGETAGVVEANTEVTVHVVAVRSAGISAAWAVAGNGRSSLRVYLERF